MPTSEDPSLQPAEKEKWGKWQLKALTAFSCIGKKLGSCHKPYAHSEEAHAHDYSFDDLEYLHDVRLVWASEIQGFALVDGDCRQLGDRIF